MTQHIDVKFHSNGTWTARFSNNTNSPTAIGSNIDEAVLKLIKMSCKIHIIPSDVNFVLGEN